jgi:hypothetical protein
MALAVPASLHASLMARLDRLGPAKEVAQIGAAIGREFSHALMAAVTHKAEAQLQSALDRLMAAGCCSGRVRHHTRLICSSTHWYGTRPMAPGDLCEPAFKHLGDTRVKPAARLAQQRASAFKLACGRLPDSGGDLCSQPTISRWENAPTLREIIRLTYALVDIWCRSYQKPPRSVVLDIDDTVDVVHGHQQLAQWNAHYDERSWILEPSVTGLCKPDLHVFAKLFEDCLIGVLKPRHFLGVRLAVMTMSWISSSDTLSMSI